MLCRHSFFFSFFFSWVGTSGFSYVGVEETTIAKPAVLWRPYTYLRVLCVHEKKKTGNVDVSTGSPLYTVSAIDRRSTVELCSRDRLTLRVRRYVRSKDSEPLRLSVPDSVRTVMFHVYC